MHNEAFEFLRKFATTDSISVIEIGSRDINGTCRTLFPNAKWIGLDRYPGACVDVVCDAEGYVPSEPVDVVMCMETLEHAKNWQGLICSGISWLKPCGQMIITCAGPGREPHSAIDGGPCYDGEYYCNVNVLAIEAVAIAHGARNVKTWSRDTDSYAVVAR